MILALNTAQDEAELYLYEKDNRIDSFNWPAGRKLSRQLLAQIEAVLKRNRSGWDRLEGIIIFAGPGSFTGLRIGFTTANAIAYSRQIPVVSAGGKNWQKNGLGDLKQAKPGNYPSPDYGAEANITLPKAK